VPSIEEQFRKAFEEGKFDNLPGKGKPLHLDDDSLVDPEWRLAYHVLHSSGYSLPWIVTRQEILADLQEVRDTLTRTWEWCQAEQEAMSNACIVTQEWQRAREAFKKRLDEINQKIFRYNLEVPSPQLQLAVLNAEREVVRLTSTISSDTL
jgi:DnaJ family protein C protein 28